MTVQTSGFVRIAIDNSVVNWKAFQGREPVIQADDEKRREYEAIERLFELQERYRVVLVAVDQVDREARKTSDESKRTKLLETLKLCNEKFYLTRFERSTFSKKAAKVRGKSGINLGDGATPAKATKKQARLQPGTGQRHGKGEFWPWFLLPRETCGT